MIDKDNLQRLYEKVRALRNHKRNEILELIGDKGKTISELEELTEEVQSVVSQHVAILKDAGFVYNEKKGEKYYLKQKELDRFNGLSDGMYRDEADFEDAIRITKIQNNTISQQKEQIYFLNRQMEIQKDIIFQMGVNIELLKQQLENER